MKNSLIKFLPIIAAVLLATSCSKDDNDNAPATQSGSDGVETVTANTIPFSIRVNTGHSLKKVGYAESTNEGEKGWYNITFSDNDVAKLKMIIKEGNTQIGEATLDNAKTATFSGGLTQQPSSNADLTAEISVSGSKNSSDVSLAELLATCAHKFLGTFKYGAAEVTLTDQNAYLDITYRESNKIDINSSEITVTDSRVWVAVPAQNAVTSQALGISKAADEVKPGTIYTVVRNFTPKAFSVSPTKKVYFSRGNLQYNPKQNQWQFAAHQYDICIKVNNNDVSSMYNKDYDGWIDLFGWGMWLDKSTLTDSRYADNINPLKTSITSATDYLSYDDNGSKVVYQDDLNALGRSAMGSEWTLLTCGNDQNPGEWNYLLGLKGCTARANAANLNHWATVNDVPGLVILPDDYAYESIDWDNYDWADLEKAGAVFLPASGYRYGTGVRDIGDNGIYYSSSPDEYRAFFLFFGHNGVGSLSNDRYFGPSVRLVRTAL